MSRTITIDPVTRIEGHLKIEVEIDGGKVVDARSSGTMYRGFEKLLEGREPRDAPFVTSRICGVCFSVHSMASVMALEVAYGARVPPGARIIRNLLMGAEYLYDHLVHFYLLSVLDYIDVKVVKDYRGRDAELLAVKDKIMGLLQTNGVHPLLPHYKPDGFSSQDPELVLTLIKHYLAALRLQMICKKMGAILGGRAPHYRSIIVGGVTQLPNSQSIESFRQLLAEASDFIRSTYLKDVDTLANGLLAPLAKSGFGAGHTRYLSYGAFLQQDGEDPLFAPGVLFYPDSEVTSPDLSAITESVRHSWYRDQMPVHPANGEQEVDLSRPSAYSFIKAPRYQGQAMEVGPLARMLVLQEPTLVAFLKNGGKPGVVARHLSRALEIKLLIDAMPGWLDALEKNLHQPGFAIHDTEHWQTPDMGEGVGLYEAPRGALGHWVEIKDKKINRYQAVVPSTWNASPRDEKGIRGPYEESLMGIDVPDADNPLNVVRVIRSFDPCLACAVHMLNPKMPQLRKFIIDPMLGI